MAMKNAIRTTAIIVMAMLSLYYVFVTFRDGIQCGNAEVLSLFCLVSDADFHCACDLHPNPDCRNRD
jgi:hypothetical protein